MKRTTTVSLIFLTIALVLTAGAALPAFAEFMTEWYWFGQLGFAAVFTTRLTTKIGLGLGFGAVALVVLWVNLRVAQRGVVPDPVIVRIGNTNRATDVYGLLRKLSTPLALVLAFPFAVSAVRGWLMLRAFLARTPFGVADPVFGRDVGYYVFTLPALSGLLDWVLGLVVVSLLLVVPLYLIRRDIIMVGRRLQIEPDARRHLATLIALLFVIVAVHRWFVDLPSLVYSHRGPLTGASYTDLAVTAPALRLTAVVTLAGAALVVWGARGRQFLGNVVIAIVLALGVSLAGAGAAAALQKFGVAPNELVRETPQIEHHIAATREAWGLNHVTVRDLTGEQSLSLADVRANSGTIRNVRLWDRDLLLQTFGQIQSIRTYYDFDAVDDDRYWIDGVYRQVLLSARELNPAALPARSFINERLTYTHGMGLTLTPVNEMTQEGLPVLFIEDLPPVSHVSLKITRPGIYFGQVSNDYVFVNTRQREFDYPAGDENAFTTYDGKGGVPIRSLWRKLLYSLRFGSIKILLSDDISNESRVLYHRDIRDRARTALPFLTWDSDPCLVITDDGRLVWMFDAYTRSARYPYSQSVDDGTNYLRNSVKAVIDAYDGTLTAYMADSTDPIIQTYAKIFPGIFHPMSEMPADVRAHLRYPDDIFRVQTALYTLYHMQQPDIFYHREDQWQIPTSLSGQNGDRDPFLRHMVMKLPGEPQEEFIVMTPFTPRDKDNLAAWMVARMDGDHYGELVVYQFPRQSLVFGPRQIMNRINQNTEISQQVSLWDQRGSQVLRGNLLVIPIEESLLYVQAVYLRAEGGRIPELKRIVLAHQNRVVMAETFEQGLADLFRGAEQPGAVLPQRIAAAAESVGPATTGRIAALIRQAATEYERATTAQRAGDWATYGEAMKRVGELLAELRRAAGGP
ncbi:MAG: UPF0182 family protein [Gemmatimonadota bacterium]|nr:UPF0182 family protein [Gemmatimonadota bacterium]